MNHKLVETSQILADLKYFDGLHANQVKKYSDILRSDTTSGSPEEHLSKLVEKVATCLGEISARIEIIETALSSTTSPATEAPATKIEEVICDTIPPNVVELENLLPEEVVVESGSLATLSNFHDTEYTRNNLAYNWTGKDYETHVDILVSRDVEKQLRLRIVNTLKQDAIRRLTIRVDDQQVSHQSVFDGELTCILASLPSEENRTTSTRVTLVFPEPCKPESLSNSVDNRYLGFAINSIIIGYPEITQASTDKAVSL